MAEWVKCKTTPQFPLFWQILEFGAGGDEGLSSLIAGELLEVLHEAPGEILGLNLPLLRSSVGVAGIEDVSVHLIEFGGDGKVEVRDGCGLSLVHAAVEDAVDDGAGILDGGVSLMEIRLPVPFQPVFTR